MTTTIFLDINRIVGPAPPDWLDIPASICRYTELLINELYDVDPQGLYEVIPIAASGAVQDFITSGNANHTDEVKETMFRVWTDKNWIVKEDLK